MKNMVFCNFKGTIIEPTNPEYEKARQGWNRAIQKFPIAIAYCENSCDVSKAILYARKHWIPIRVRSGAHNYEGYSNGDRALIIDVSKINSANIDYNKNTLTVGGGIKNTQVYKYLGELGYPFPGGTCPTVGVAGYASGGGWGLSVRKFGLGCDSLLEVEIVDYKGCVLKANQNTNKDLFWAIKGAGGGNFGVIVSMTFKLPPKVDKVTYFSIYYPNTNKETQVEFLDTWQNWLYTADNSISINGGLYNTLVEGKYIYIRGISYNDEQKTKELLESFLSIKGSEISLEYDSFYNIIKKIQSGYPPYEYFKSTGRFVTRKYTLDEISKLVDIVNQEKPTNSILTSLSIYSLGGKVSDVNKNESAYYYRDAKYILSIQSVWENYIYKKENVDWVVNNFGYIKSITAGSYINFPIIELPNYELEYYGENAYKLQTVKLKYDPCNVFNFPQSIR